jgi:hypothetical protein
MRGSNHRPPWSNVRRDKSAVLRCQFKERAQRFFNQSHLYRHWYRHLAARAAKIRRGSGALADTRRRRPEISA